MGLGDEQADDETDPILLAFDEGGPAMEKVLTLIERGKVGARFRAGGWKAMGEFISLYDWLCCYCPNNPDAAKIFAARFLLTLPGREREMMIEKFFGEGGEK